MTIALLPAGPAILTVELGPALDRPTLLEGLVRAGLADPLVDLSAGETALTFSLVVRAPVPCDLESSDELWFRSVLSLPIDPYADLGPHVTAAKLDPGRLYAVRFLSRMALVGGRRVLAHDRPFVEGALREAQFPDVLALSCLHKNMRLPGLPNASHALWIGLVRYSGPLGHLTDVEPGLVFETCEPVEEPATPSPDLPISDAPPP